MFKTFFTDLDNTIIYSHRHKIDEPFMWIEELNGKYQSYITEKTYEYFKCQNWLRVVPVTTRIYSQYKRIENFLSDMKWDSVLICNGAILLNKGKADREWYEESMRIYENERRELEHLLSVAYLKYPKNSIVTGDKFMFYIKSETLEEDHAFLLNNADLSCVSIIKDSRKIYCIPHSFDKANAVRRYNERFGINEFYAAGDSEFDKKMLDIADVSFYPLQPENGFAEYKKVIARESFSNHICIELEKLRNEVEHID